MHQKKLSFLHPVCNNQLIAHGGNAGMNYV
jgi:hypothetical protein